MKKIAAIIVIVGLVAWGLYTAGVQMNASTGQGPVVGLEKGNLAPDFELRTLEGQAIKLSSLKGKKVILNMWATWCPPCRLEMPDMEKFYINNKNAGLEILAVNLIESEKSREDVPEFIKEFGLTFPVVLDEKSEVSKLYQVLSIPTSYFIDTQGVIQQKIVGPMNYDMMKKIIDGLK